jgi:hypothetical protein
MHLPLEHDTLNADASQVQQSQALSQVCGVVDHAIYLGRLQQLRIWPSILFIARRRKHNTQLKLRGDPDGGIRLGTGSRRACRSPR